jgi:integrase/recombinase XerD
MPGPKPKLHLAYTRWPSSDRSLWERAFCHDDPFAEVRLAKASKERCMWAWRRYLGFLANNEPEALQIPPAERLTVGRVKLFAAHLAETNAPNSVASLVEALYTAARAMMTDHDWNWLKAIKSRLQLAAPAKSAAGPVITSVRLLDLGQKLMDESQPAPGAPISTRDAVRYRDGLMVAFVAFIPIRPKNLAALEISRHVVLEGDQWFVIIPNEETKTGTPIEFLVPEILVSYLELYLEVVRPRILRRGTCKALWVSPKGGALSYVGIVKSFQRLSDRLGVHIAPHDARDAAATTWAISAPEHIGVVRDLLTHSDLRTLKHYNRAKGIEASRAYGQVIAGIRRKQNRRSPLRRGMVLATD